VYAVIGPLYPVLKALIPKYVTTTECVGRAMINVARRGAPHGVLESQDINALAGKNNPAKFPVELFRAGRSARVAFLPRFPGWTISRLVPLLPHWAILRPCRGWPNVYFVGLNVAQTQALRCPALRCEARGDDEEEDRADPDHRAVRQAHRFGAAHVHSSFLM